MLTVEQIRQKAERKYMAYLSSLISNEHFFPLEITGSKQIDEKSGVYSIVERLAPVIRESKANKGVGFTLQIVTVNTKQGKIDRIKRIEFLTEEDYILFLNKEGEVASFKEKVKKTLDVFPELKSTLIQSPGIVINNIDKWNEILEICSYFKYQEFDPMYLREVPVKVHSKFLESNTSVLLRLLEVLVPQKLNLSAQSFEEKLGLKAKHNLLRIRFLDESIRLLEQFDELGIAEKDLTKLNIQVEKVFIIENDINALTFPFLSSSIAVFGRGYNLRALRDLRWLKESEIFYWSDIDVQGFEMLSQIRSYYPHVKSFLMDGETLSRFTEELIAGVPSKAGEPPNLNAEELAIYEIIRSGNLRLEQERITQQYLLAALRNTGIIQS